MPAMASIELSGVALVRKLPIVSVAPVLGLTDINTAGGRGVPDAGVTLASSVESLENDQPYGWNSNSDTVCPQDTPTARG